MDYTLSWCMINNNFNSYYINVHLILINIQNCINWFSAVLICKWTNVWHFFLSVHFKNYAQSSYFFTLLCFGTSIFCLYLSRWLQWCWGNPTTDPSHKSHKAVDKYTTMHHFVTEMCKQVHISVTKWFIVGYWTGGALWDSCNNCICNQSFHTINLHKHNANTTKLCGYFMEKAVYGRHSWIWWIICCYSLLLLCILAN